MEEGMQEDHTKWSNNSRASWQDYHRYLRKRQTQTNKTKTRKRGFEQNVWGFIWDVVGGAIEQVPRALWNIANLKVTIYHFHLEPQKRLDSRINILTTSEKSKKHKQKNYDRFESHEVNLYKNTSLTQQQYELVLGVHE